MITRSGATDGKQRQNGEGTFLEVLRNQSRRSEKHILETLHFPVVILNTVLWHLWQTGFRSHCVILTTDCIHVKFAAMKYYPWLVLMQWKEDFAFKEIEKHKRRYLNTTAFYHKAHIPPTTLPILRNLQDKNLCLKLPFNQFFFASPQALLQHSAASQLQLWPGAHQQLRSCPCQILVPLR